MNKTSVFYSKNSLITYEFGKYCAQICGPSKLLSLDASTILDIKKLPKFLIFLIYIIEDKNNESEKNLHEENINDKQIQLKKLLNNKIFNKTDIDLISQILSLSFLNNETEIFFVFVLENITDKTNQSENVNSNYFFNKLELAIKLINGYYFYYKNTSFEKDLIIDFFRTLRIQTLSPAKQMEQKSLSNIIYKFITEHEVCVISTGYQNYVRSTVVEYIFRNNKFYIISESGEKYANLSCNKNISLTIFDSINTGGRTKCIQVQGIAKVYDFFDDNVKFILSSRGLDKNTIDTLNFDLYLIQIEPLSIELYDPSFKNSGYSTRQIFDPNNFH